MEIGKPIKTVEYEPENIPVPDAPAVPDTVPDEWEPETVPEKVEV